MFYISCAGAYCIKLTLKLLQWTEKDTRLSLLMEADCVNICESNEINKVQNSSKVILIALC
jgi:hypothetical protein